MTRQDYILIAGAIADSRAEIRRANLEETHADAYYALDVLTDRLADSLALDNPRFDRDRFTKASGRLSA